MKYSNITKLSSLLVVFALFLTACGEDPASSFGEDPPAFPEFESLDADLGYFENNSQSTGQESTGNFTDAYFYAIGFSQISTVGMGYTSFFNSADQSEAEFVDGEWRWEYSYSFDGQSVSIVLISRDAGNDIAWEMIWSFDDGQGNSIEDYTIIEGRSAKDGSSGSWTFNSLNPDTNEEEPFLVSTWERISETEYELVIEFYEGGMGIATYTLTKDGDTFDIVYNAPGSEESIYVHWETGGGGYYQIGDNQSNRYCWNADFINVECS